METLVKASLSGPDDVAIKKKIPLFLPEHLLAWLFGTLGLQMPPGSVQRYWDHAKNNNCPWQDLSHDGSHIPLGLYGDGAKYSPDGKKIIGYFLNVVIWCPRLARMSRWLLFSLENGSCLGARSLNPLFAVIVQSLARCFNGIDVQGGTLRFVVSELRGDWEWHALSFGMRRTWRQHEMCWRCECSRAPTAVNNFMDLRDDPMWQATEFSHLQFLANCISTTHPCCSFASSTLKVSLRTLLPPKNTRARARSVYIATSFRLSIYPPL